MRWQRANLEEKQEPRAATSASAKRHTEEMWHDLTRKTLTKAAIEKQTFNVRFFGPDDFMNLNVRFREQSGPSSWAVKESAYSQFQTYLFRKEHVDGLHLDS